MEDNLTWRMVWVERPATKVVQFQKDNEVMGSLSLNSDDKDDIILFQELQHALNNLEMKRQVNDEAVTRIN
jgi:hypothetical protein